MILSKEFFSVIKRALQEASWKRTEFAMVEAVERELNMLLDHQSRVLYPMMNASLGKQTTVDEIIEEKINPVPPIKYSPAPTPIVRDETGPMSLTAENGLSPVSTGYAPAATKKVKKAVRKVKDNSVAEVPKANGNPNGMSASPEGMAAIDMMIQAGIEQAKVAPVIEKRLLSHVVVEKMPESQEQYETESLV